jgi:tetratricopeptide (TPR) repeat protein
VALDRHHFITRPWTLRHEIRTMRQASEATRDELRRVAESVEGSSGDVVRAIREAAQENQAVLWWGFSEVLGALNAQTEVLKNILDTLREPQRTKSLEQLRNGIRAFELGVQQAYETGLSDGANLWFDDAVSDFRDAVALNRYESRGYWYLGWIHLDQGKDTEASQAFNNAAHYSWPDYPELSATALIGRSIVEERNGQLDDAVNSARQAVSRLGDHAVTHYHLAKYLAMRGTCEEAQEYVRNAIYLDPDYFIAATVDTELRHCPEVDRMLAQLTDAARVYAAERVDTLMKLTSEAMSDLREWDHGSPRYLSVDEVVGSIVDGAIADAGYSERTEGRHLGTKSARRDVRQLTHRVRSTGSYSELVREVPELAQDIEQRIVTWTIGELNRAKSAYHERAKASSPDGSGCIVLIWLALTIIAGGAVLLGAEQEPDAGFEYVIFGFSIIALGVLAVLWWFLALARSSAAGSHAKRLEPVLEKWHRRQSR